LVKVEATGNNHADADALAIAFGLFAGAAVDPNAEVTSQASVEALIGSPATVTVGSAPVDVTATSSDTATASSTGASASIVGIQLMDVDATVRGSTRSFVNDGATITAGSVNLLADATTAPTASVSSIGISLVGGGAASATATDTRLVEAFIG